MKYCPNCGKAEVEDMKFCPQCGQKLTDSDLKEDQKYVQKPERSGGKMRIAAGSLIIVLGVFSFLVPGAVEDAIAWGRATSWDEYFSIRQDIGVQMALPTLLLIVFIVGGGICAPSASRGR